MKAVKIPRPRSLLPPIACSILVRLPKRRPIPTRMDLTARQDPMWTRQSSMGQAQWLYPPTFIPNFNIVQGSGHIRSAQICRFTPSLTARAQRYLMPTFILTPSRLPLTPSMQMRCNFSGASLTSNFNGGKRIYMRLKYHWLLTAHDQRFPVFWLHLPNAPHRHPAIFPPSHPTLFASLHNRQ